jgi:membrane protein
LSYYFFLALFPMLLFMVSLAGIMAGHSSQFRDHIIAGLRQLAPPSASDLVHRVVNGTAKASSGLKLAVGLVGALWAASGGMSAIGVSLNVVHETKETRPWWKQKLTVIMLTLILGALIILALALVLYGGKLGQVIAVHSPLGRVFRIIWLVVCWVVALAAMLFSYSLVFYYAPDLDDRKWFWVTPGAVVGIALWLAASYGLRIYLHFFNSYSATYGSLGAVIILMLWLYVTAFALLTGGAVNWVVENQEKEATNLEKQRQEIQRKLRAA